jgi:ComF family protein
MNALKLIDRVLDLVYPPVCALCSQGCDIAICGKCSVLLELVGEDVCRKCGADLLPGARACRECRGREFLFSRAVAVGSYVGTLRDLLLRFKLGGEQYLAREFGRRLAQRVLDEGLEADAVAAVPMRAGALIRRRYNPAEDLARCVAGALQRPYVPALKKVRSTKPQATLPMKERASNPAGAFAVRRPKLVRSRSILLVDDVLTTGATANECARALLEAGAREVNLAVVGR